jgi:hypothetical protein
MTMVIVFVTPIAAQTVPTNTQGLKLKMSQATAFFW